VSEPLVPREEARATLEARRELGPAYEDELVERFAQKLEERLKRQPPSRAGAQSTTAITVVSILAAIPLIAIAGGTAGLPGVALVCLAIVLVNLLAMRR
jgi:hypothetical protein